MKISKKVFIFSLFLASLSLVACSGLTQSDIPANRTWWLKPYTDLTPETAPEIKSLVSVSVTAVPGLDTNWILTLSHDAELSRYTAARWADNLPELFESLLGRTLEASGRFTVAPGRVRAGSEDCDLQLELREFFAELDGDGKTERVRVGVFGRYQCGSAEPVPVLSSASVAVHDERMSVIVAAFQQAVDRVLKEMLENLS